MAGSRRPLKLAMRLTEIGIGAVFIFAGAIKACDPAAFANDIHHYRITPWMVSVAVALYLPWLEILCGLCLAVRRFEAGATGVALGLMTVFTIALLSAWVRGLDIACGCFGPSGAKTDYPFALARDAGLIAVLLFVASTKWKRKG